jgi:hypothetical protein
LSNGTHARLTGVGKLRVRFDDVRGPFHGLQTMVMVTLNELQDGAT